MRPGPVAVAQTILTQVSVVAGPKPLVELIATAAVEIGWFSSLDDAREGAERWKAAVLQRLRTEIDALHRLGRFSPITFNTSSPDYIQGSAFVEPGDSVEAKAAKERRAHFSEYVRTLQELSPRQFECLCCGLLGQFGVLSPVVTQASADEGIDFYGHLPIGEKLLPQALFPGVHSQMSVWMVGQAKHFLKGKVSTPDIRELVGSVLLARSRAFSVNTEKYIDLRIRACDPVFFLFFTTGQISAYGWTLLDSAGVIGMDGEMVASFLADNAIGIENNGFQKTVFLSWVENQLK